MTNRQITDRYWTVHRSSPSEIAGAVFLGILALILLVALLRSETRNRALVAQLSQQGR